MTQRTIQLTQHGMSLVIWLIALNSLYTLFSTFEKALSNSEKQILKLKVLEINRLLDIGRAVGLHTALYKLVKYNI